MTEVTVDITAKMGFDEDTVNRCLTIIEWYLDDNPQCTLSNKVSLNGKHVLKIIKGDK